MGSKISLSNLRSIIVADTSVLINLDASRHALEIVKALPIPLAMAKSVLGELEDGKAKGKKGLDSIMDLAAKGLIKTLTKGDIAKKIFEGLVIGDSASTLDDGEAETIAIAIEQGAMALIDERKANRICSERFPDLPVVCTLDILSHSEVCKALGRPILVEAVESALRDGRMNTPEAYLDWVLDLIGKEKALSLRSLPRKVRVSSKGHSV